MNKSLKIFTAIIAVGTAFTVVGCDGCSSCSSCNGAAAPNTITRSNWYTGTSYGGIQPSFVITDDDKTYEDYAEKLTYKVTYSAPSGTGNPNYSVEYAEGTFKTEFYATKFDWTKAGIPAGYADSEGKVKSETVYVYKMTLDIPSVTFKMKVGDKAEKTFAGDKVESECYFRAAGKNLQPIYSKQTVISNSPALLQPTSIDEAHMEVNATYENFYNYDCTKVLSKATEKGKTTQTEYGLSKLSNALFDNSSLYIVARSFLKKDSAVSQSICLFSAVAGGADTYAVSGSDAELTDKEGKEFADVLSKKNLFKKEKDDSKVGATAVTISFAGGDLHGTRQTVWYAQITDLDNNVSRATMLKLSTPLSFGLGTLNYSLTEVNSTLW